MRAWPLLFVACLVAVSGCTSTKRGVSPKEEKLLYQAGAAENAGKHSEAIKYYREAVSESQGGVRAHLGLAEFYKKKGKLSDAADLLVEASKLQPKNAEVLKELGNIYIAQQDADAALEQFEQGVSFNPKDARLYNGKGVALDMRGDNAGAQDSYRKAIKLAPGNSAYVKNNLALSLLMTRDYDEAIRILTALSDSKDSSATIRQNLSMAYALKGNVAKAREIGLQDLPKAKVEQNLAFYKKLAADRAKQKAPPKAKRSNVDASAEWDDTSVERPKLSRTEVNKPKKTYAPATKPHRLRSRH